MSRRPRNDIKEEKIREKKRITGRDAAELGILSLSVSIAVFVLAPLYIISASRADFPLKTSELLVPMLIAGLVNTALLSGVLLLLRRFAGGFGAFVIRLIAGFLPAAFVQTVFLNSPSTVYTGYNAIYADPTFRVFSNLGIYILIMLLPQILHIIAKKLPSRRNIAAADRNSVMCIGAAALAVLTVWTGVKAAKTDLSEYDSNYYGYLSYDNALSLSEKENIVVILSDRLDSYYMDEMLKRYPDIADKFDGFTFYQNNVSHSTNTFPSVAQMLTGELYDGGEWQEYMRKAWDGDSVPELLKKAGYDVNIIPDSTTTTGALRDMDGIFDNISYYDEDSAKVSYLGEYGVIQALGKLSLSRMAPYIAKGGIAGGLGTNVGRFMIVPDSVPEDRVPFRIKPYTDVRLYNYLNSHGLRADNENRTFSFIHLSGSHNLSSELAGLYEEVNGEADVYETTRGAFEIIFSYFDQLRELGIYDNTTIIVLGDHGRPPNETDGVVNLKLKSEIVTALLVKPAGAESAPIAYDRDSELSNDYFGASILEYAGLDHSSFGYSYNDIIENDLHPDRYLQSVKFINYGSLKYTAKYRITGDARDFDNWEELEGHEND